VLAPVKSGTNPNTATIDGTTPFYIAAERGLTETVRTLVQDCGADANTANNNGKPRTQVIASTRSTRASACSSRELGGCKAYFRTREYIATSVYAPPHSIGIPRKTVLGSIGLEVISAPSPALWGVADASYASYVITRRSDGGYMLFLNGGCVRWKRSLQKMVTMSSCETEFVTLCLAKQGRKPLSHLGMSRGDGRQAFAHTFC
jgi:hypothetical protein